MKILVIYASAGAGHFKAAQAIFESVKKYTSHQAVLVNALDYTQPYFKKSYEAAYVFLVSKLPLFWGIFFGLADWKLLQPLWHIVRRWNNGWHGKALEHFLEKEQFDVIFSTHFFPNETAAFLKRKGEIHSQIISVVTDFDVHKFWIQKGVDRYVVAVDWTKEKLKKLGVLDKNISVLGIPINDKFSTVGDRIQVKRKLGLREDVFTVLLATGSFGIGPMAEIVEALKSYQVLVVCGKNQKLKENLSRREDDLLKVFGLVDNMHELMAAADVMITKPGGLSTSEALATQLPLIFFHPIPGQEVNNIKVLSHYGVGIYARSVARIVEEVGNLSSSRDRYLTAVKKIRSAAHPSAVKEIISLIQ